MTLNPSAVTFLDGIVCISISSESAESISSGGTVGLEDESNTFNGTKVFKLFSKAFLCGLVGEPSNEDSAERIRFWN